MAQKTATRPSPARVASSPTLASMASKAASASASVPTKVADTAPAINWDAFKDAEISTYTRAPSKVDREATTPEFVKRQVRKAFAAGQEKGEVTYMTLSLSKEAVDDFVKFARLYAKFLGYTFRGGPNVKVAGEVRFAVKNFEARPRKTEAEKAAIAAAKAAKK